MFKEKRQEAIVSYTDQHGQIEVEALAAQFHVSPMTIRRDLGELEAKGYLKKVYGGAISSANLPLNNVNDIYS